MTRGTSGWTEPMMAELKALCGEGKLSFAGMAAVINLAHGSQHSRNAIIGKAKRLGLANPVKLSGRPTGGAPAKPREFRRAPAKPPKKRLHLIGANMTPEARLEQEALYDDPAGQDTPFGQRRILLDLSNETCRWPIGQPSDQDFFFCGALADLNDRRPYCAHHTRMARQVYRPR